MKAERFDLIPKGGTLVTPARPRAGATKRAKRDASVEDDQVFHRGLAVLTRHDFAFDLCPFVEKRQSRPFDGAQAMLPPG